MESFHKASPRCKFKLGFIDGSCVKPDSYKVEIEKWIQCDYMIRCWILNTMSKDLAKSYATFAKELWDEVLERYGQVNSPLLYQIQIEIANMHQGNMSVIVYYNKIKRL